jgi:hypothetical protein
VVKKAVAPAMRKGSFFRKSSKASFSSLRILFFFTMAMKNRAVDMTHNYQKGDPDSQIK